MTSNKQLELQLLRTLVIVAEEGSFSRAAVRIGLTQAAVSLQIKRLEAMIGREIMHRRRGSAIELNGAGRILYMASCELLAQSDRILEELRSTQVEGEVRLGLWEGYAKTFLASPLTRYSELHPRVTVEVFSGLSCQLFPLMIQNRLDALVCDGGMEPPGWPNTVLRSAPLRWVASENMQPREKRPLPVSLGPANCPWRPSWLPECPWRKVALQRLDQAGRHYRSVPSLTSVAGWDQAVLSGDAVTVTSLPVLPSGLRYATENDDLPDLPVQTILLLVASGARQPVTDHLAAHLATMCGELTSDKKVMQGSTKK